MGKESTMTKEQIQKMTCIVCPTGCQLEVVTTAEGTIDVSGAQCPRGVAYGKNEILNPTRVLTTTVKIRGGSLPLLPVRTARAIAKQHLQRAMMALREVEVSAPVRTGDVIVANLLATGIDVVASRDMEGQ